MYAQDHSFVADVYAQGLDPFRGRATPDDQKDDDAAMSL